MSGAGQFTSLAEAHLYADEIVFAETSPYQRIVITRWKDDLRLFLNNNLQFSSRDEYRYHEALVHPGLSTLPGARRILVLGGGDGLAVREILKYPQIETVTLVDLDPAMTQLFSSATTLRKLNDDALHSPKVRVVNEDALQWLENNDEIFDFVVVDFPDPSNFAIGKLYSAAFYRLLEKTPERRCARRRSIDVAALRPAIVLVRGDDAGERRPQRYAVSRAWCRPSANGVMYLSASAPTSRLTAMPSARDSSRRKQRLPCSSFPRTWRVSTPK